MQVEGVWEKSLFSTNVTLRSVLLTVRPSGVVSRVPRDSGKLVTLLAGSTKRRRLLITRDGRRSSTHQWIMFMTGSPDVTPKTTEQNIIVRIGKSEKEVTNNANSSDVAERPRDASCLSVVSFSSIKRRAQFLLLVTSALDLPLRTTKFYSVLFSSSWSSMLAVINKIRLYVSVCAVNFTAYRRNGWSHSSSHRSDSQIFVENRDFSLPTCIRRPD